MSYAIRCDRCGETVPTPAPFGDTPKGWLMLAQQHGHHEVPADSRGYHFCSDCTTSFDDWLEFR